MLVFVCDNVGKMSTRNTKILNIFSIYVKVMHGFITFMIRLHVSVRRKTRVVGSPTIDTIVQGIVAYESNEEKPRSDF